MKIVCPKCGVKGELVIRKMGGMYYKEVKHVVNGKEYYHIIGNAYGPSQIEALLDIIMRINNVKELSPSLIDLSKESLKAFSKVLTDEKLRKVEGIDLEETKKSLYEIKDIIEDQIKYIDTINRIELLKKKRKEEDIKVINKAYADIVYLNNKEEI